MENNTNGRNDMARPTNDRRDATNSRLEEIRNLRPDPTLPYDDPAVINPEELATFPKKSEIMDAADVEAENKTTLVNQRSAVRVGRNIVRTDNDPNNDGFM